MTEGLLYLLPDILIQILLGVLLLWLFVRDKDNVGLEKILLTSLLFMGLNLGIEWLLHDFLLATTLVIQWAFFVLLASHICSIPLPRASMTLFCYFSLMMGQSMIQNHLHPETVSEEEKMLLSGFEDNKKENTDSAQFPEWALRLERGLLRNKTFASRDWVRDFMYPYSVKKPSVNELAPLPSPTEAPEVISIDTTPSTEVFGGTDEATPTPDPTRAPTEGMTGAEFELLFFSQDPQISEAIAESITAEPSPTPAPMVSTSFVPGVNSEQMEDILEIRNISNDPKFAPPLFEISAVSMGAKGRFAIVDGEVIREGSTISNPNGTPRNWRLIKIETDQLHWQPVR